MKKPFESARLRFRPIAMDDAQDLFELDSNPKVHRFLGNRPAASITESVEVVKKILSQYEEFDIGRWAVIEKVSGAFLGWAGLKYELDLRSTAYYDIGYRFKEQYWGKGFAGEAAQAWINHGFNELHLNQICGAAHVDNLASNKILTKIGLIWKEEFVVEGNRCNWYESNS